MAVVLREKSKDVERVVVSLEENVKGYNGLDLFVFDKGSVFRSLEGLEARLVYSPYVVCDEGRNLVKGIARQTKGVVVQGDVREFTTADYLASVDGKFRAMLRVKEGADVFMEVKQAANVAVFQGIMSKLYESDEVSRFLLFRYHPRCTRWWRFGAAGMVGVASGVGAFSGDLLGVGSAGGVVGYASMIVGAAVGAGLVMNGLVRYGGPLFMSGKSMLVDVKRKQDESLWYVKKVEELKECLRLQEERNDGVFKYRRFARKKEKMERKAAGAVKAAVSMKFMMKEMYQAVCELEGLHVTYVEPVSKDLGRKSYDEVRGLLYDLVPDKK